MSARSAVPPRWPDRLGRMSRDRRKIGAGCGRRASVPLVSRATLCVFVAARDVAKSSGAELARSLVFDLETCGNHDTRRNRRLVKYLVTATSHHAITPGKLRNVSHTIFEGTSEIQQLVIARAISGMRIE